MFFQILTVVFMGEVLVASADAVYGVVSNFPELKIQDAGPSQQYPWVGYTSHFPKTVPRPLLLHRWQPYVDPTYTAFWVSEKETGHLPEYKGLDDGGVPHGFGEPKPSSIKGNLIDTFSGPTGPLQTYQQPGPSDSYVQPNAIAPTIDNSLDIGHVAQQAPATAFVQQSVPENVYHEPAQVIQSSPVVHQIDDDYTDGGFVQQSGEIYQAPAVAIGHSESYIEPGQLVHSELYVDEGVYQAQAATIPQEASIVPFVKPPHSEPLPLENEGASNELLGQVYNVQRSSN